MAASGARAPPPQEQSTGCPPAFFITHSCCHVSAGVLGEVECWASGPAPAALARPGKGRGLAIYGGCSPRV